MLVGLSKLMLTATGIVLISGMAIAQRKPDGGGGAKPNVSKPSGVNKPSPQSKSGGGGGINKPSGGAKSNNGGGINKPNNNNNNNGKLNNSNNNNNSNNKTNNIGSNNNKVNIDNSKKNVNVNIDNSKNVRVNNSRNTAVRRSPYMRPYPRPPYRYGGFRYSCYHPYFYHPYRPFVWGPMWHPWGFFITTLAVTAIIITVQNDQPFHSDMAGVPPMDYNRIDATYVKGGPAFFNDLEEYNYAEEYYYDEGVFYQKADGGYTVVAAPVGATIKTLPKGYETVTVDEKTKNYYFGGTYYEKSDKGYTVVPPTAGTVVEHLPEGGEEVKLGDITYVKVGETYYQPMQEDGKNVYEVADVEADK